MVNQQNALRTAAAQGLGGAPLILSHHARLQMPSSVTTTIAGTPSAAHVTAAGLINGSLGIKNILLRFFLFWSDCFKHFWNIKSFRILRIDSWFFRSPTTATTTYSPRWHQWSSIRTIRISASERRLCSGSKLFWTHVSSFSSWIRCRSNWWVVCALTSVSLLLVSTESYVT